MFASVVSPDRCQLYTIALTNLRTWDRTILTYPLSDFDTVAEHAAWCQRMFDPDRKYYDWRVHMCG